MNTFVWKAGAAQAEFFVPAGTPMGGYAARTGPSTGTLDLLAITALWLEAGDANLAIVGADIVAVDAALTAAVARAAGVPRDSLLLAASHTHSGPAGIGHKLHLSNTDTIDKGLRRRFVRTCAAAIDAARSQAEPASLWFGHAPAVGLAGNRNSPDWTDANTHDPGITILEVLSYGLESLATVVHWPCHPTILGADNRLISADFPGALRRVLGEREEHGAVLYLNGAAGDISTRFTRRGQNPAEVERFGRELAAGVEEARCDMRELSSVLHHRSVRLSLPGWSDDDIRKHLHGATVSAPSDDRRSVTRAQGRAMLEVLAVSAIRPRRRSVRLDVWRIGETALVAMPGELFSSLGAKIGRALSSPVMVVGYAGGYAGYFPDRQAYDEETYEALASPYGPGCGERVALAAKSLVRSLAGDTFLTGSHAGAPLDYSF